MGNEGSNTDETKCRLEAISDEHPAWTAAMEAWWENGGALLWNQYGGMGLQVLILEPEEATKFLRAAAHIEGWGNHIEDVVSWRESPARPVVVTALNSDDLEQEPDSKARTTQTQSAASIQCCRQCGREINPALRDVWSGDPIHVSPRVLNHLINSLNEAIDFATAVGPNNFRTWQATLEQAANMLIKKG
ncbi:MAG: hypothetical protein QG577_648 [Thermodesulfobacteriota bacterium]|nr:hypothetical protein [Thermodesulfobacteriota bacterium]